jgi:hypothetical protein
MACRHGDDNLPIVKMLFHHPEIQVNQQAKVVIIESIYLGFFLFFSIFFTFLFRMVRQHCIMLLIMVMY